MSSFRDPPVDFIANDDLCSAATFTTQRHGDSSHSRLADLLQQLKTDRDCRTTVQGTGSFWTGLGRIIETVTICVSLTGPTSVPVYFLTFGRSRAKVIGIHEAITIAVALTLATPCIVGGLFRRCPCTFVEGVGYSVSVTISLVCGAAARIDLFCGSGSGAGIEGIEDSVVVRISLIG